MSKTVKLSEVKDGGTFFVGGVEYIKFPEKDGATPVLAKNSIFTSNFGSNNNLTTSKVLERMRKEFLPKVIEAVGEDNVLKFETDLTTLCGLKPYEPLVSKISLRTLEFQRKNVEILDKYKLGIWEWLATPESAQPHDDPYWILCVSPRGSANDSHYNDNSGVRPFLHFRSSISVTCEE